jgi:hypothetical protein
VTPLGLLASEPTKVFLTRHHLATRESVSSLALENIVYAASVVVMAATGGIVLLTTAPLPPEWQEGLLTAVVLALGAVAIGVLLLRRGFGSALPRFALRDRLSSLRQQLHGFDAGTIGRVFALDLLYHALAVFEILITLEWLLPGRSPTVAQAIVFERDQDFELRQQRHQDDEGDDRPDVEPGIGLDQRIHCRSYLSRTISSANTSARIATPSRRKSGRLAAPLICAAALG